MLKHKVTPLFISSELGSLFAMHFSPVSEHSSQCILHIPAFAEEMNKSRHMVVMQARMFAEQGYSVLIFDLWGTGDSQGEFSEATWAIWLNDIDAAVKWLQEKQYESISLWGLRSGALLAMDYLHQYSSTIDKLICWQPVLNGEQFMMQFLRLRIAAAMMDKNAPQEKTSDLKKQLLEGNSIEVAGYQLNPELVNPVMAIRAQQLNLQTVKQCHVFELTIGAELEAGFALAKWVKAIEQQNIIISLDIINGSLFWATQEISESPSLIQLSSDRVIGV